MELRIVKEIEEPLLKRKKVMAEAEEFGSTPKKDAIKEEIAKKLKADAATVFIEHVGQFYGSGKIDIVAFVYKDAKMSDLLTKDGLHKRQEIKKKAAAPAAS